jgi:hypothetical protein
VSVMLAGRLCIRYRYDERAATVRGVRPSGF